MPVTGDSGVVRGNKCGWSSTRILLLLTALSALVKLHSVSSVFSDEKADKTVHGEVFLFSAFRVSNDVVRVLLIQDARSRNLLSYRFGHFGPTHAIRVTECVRSACPTHHDPACTHTGFTADLPIPLQLQPIALGHLLLSSTTPTHTSLTTNLAVQDVRVANGNDGSELAILGVCLQPLFLTLSPTPLALWFEFWLQQGARFFGVYRHSVSPAVLRLLQRYAQRPDLHVHVVEWPSLPRSDAPASHDPNLFVRRLEFSLASVDCLLRARPHTRYIAMTDLDEFVHIKSRVTVAEYLRQQPMHGAFWLSTQPLRRSGDTVYLGPPVPKPLQAKLIVNAQLTKSVDVHRPGRTEAWLGKVPAVCDVPSAEAVVVHARYDFFRLNDTDQSVLTDAVEAVWLQQDLKRREAAAARLIATLGFSQKKLNELSQLQTHIHESNALCHTAFRHEKMCKSFQACLEFVKKQISVNSFIEPLSDSAWTIL